ncbi:hypothetical protein MTO96_017161 [Rhipicephalus appendiculatus]
MRDMIARLTAEVSEIRSGGGQQPVEAITQSTQSMEMPVVEECETERPAKKRAIVSEQDKASCRARSEIREMLSSLSEMHETAKRDGLAHAGQHASHGGKIQSEISKIESFLENVVAPVVDPRALPLPATANPTAQSPQQHDSHTS